MEKPVFILGTQRSGTTLLCRMLSAHPAAYVQNEFSVQRIFNSGARGVGLLDLVRSEIEKKQTEKGFRDPGGAKAEFWGVKDPELTGYIEALESLVSRAKFVVIYRDPRAVVNSYMENAWGLGTNAYSGSLRWEHEVSAQLRFRDRHPDDVLMLAYEVLVSEPEHSLRAVCEFIGWPFDQCMLDFHLQKATIRRTRENQSTWQKLDTGLATRWKGQLKRHEIWIINGVCGPLMKRLGYETAGESISLPRWLTLYYRLHQAVVGELQIQYRWRVLRQFKNWKKQWTG